MKPEHSPAGTRRRRLVPALFRLFNLRKQRFECPVCGYHGPFMDQAAQTGLRRHARCPACGALERHRLQYLVMGRVLDGSGRGSLRMLHVAPEPFFCSFFRKNVGTYVTADLAMEGVDQTVDLCSLPFADESFDIVYASHVLEHIPDDLRALSEIRRVLGKGGLAILPVPLVADRTVEYPAPNPNESGHVRAPGPDYFERYERFFSSVELVASDAFPEKHQLYIHEDRTRWPTPECPLRPPMAGHRHVDAVPVCRV